MSQGKKFGTFEGVYTPSVLTILGVIMYMRMGAVVGYASNIFMVIAIIVLAHLVSVTTGLSVSSVATDKKIKAGGIYYMLSRSLGLPIGGAIGITLFIATALSISLYLVGFGESLLPIMQDWLGIEEITTNHLRIVASIALFFVVTIAFISTSLAMKVQYIILALIGLSLVSIFFGNTSRLTEGTDVIESVSFPVLFGIFFPAVTGFTAGVAMSGDLKDPKKSIPWGTMLSVGTGLVVYLVLAIFIYFAIPSNILQTNFSALIDYGWIPILVLLGVWGATLSSALGGILGAPRILQAMSVDSITPKIFASGVGKENEPRNALVLTFIIAEIGILIGELNVIAEVLAMFYMAAYMFINLSCALEQWASPDFRPKFRIHSIIPIVGTIATFLLMIQLNLVAALASVLIMAVIFVFLTKRQLQLGSGDVWQSVWSSVVKLGLKNLHKKSTHKRNWEPNILLFSGGTEARPHLLSFSKAVAGRNGMISNFDLVENPSAKVLFPKHKQAVTKDDLVDDSIFHRKQECQNIFKGIEAIASTYGFSGVEPNTVLMGWARNTKDPIWFAQMKQKLHALDYNVMFLDYDKEKGFGNKSRIDIWWQDLSEESDLTLQIAKLMLASEDWSQAKVRVLYINQENNQKLVLEEAIRRRIDKLRIDVDFEVINNELERKEFFEIIKINSYESDLILLQIPELQEGGEATFVKNTNNFLDVMGTTLLVRASSHFYEEEGFDPILEKQYQNAFDYELDVDDNLDPVELGLPGYAALDTELHQIDNKLHALNRAFAEDIYEAYSNVYLSFHSILKEKVNEEKESVYQIVKTLVEDLEESRWEGISDVIAAGIKQHVKSLDDVVKALPPVIERVYTSEELAIVPGEPAREVKYKKKLARRKKAKIKLGKVATHHFEEGYLINLKKQLNIIGLSGFILNNKIKNWSRQLENGIDLDQLERDLIEQLKREKTIFLRELNGLGRRFCNSVTRDVSTYNINEVTIEREEERRPKKIKQSYTQIASYPENWLINQKMLTNQLLININLLVLAHELAPVMEKTAFRLTNNLIDKSRDQFQAVRSKLSKLTLEDINELEGQLARISNSVNLENNLKIVIQKIDKSLNEHCIESEVLSPQKLNDFETNQYGIEPTMINVRKVAGHLIENEIVSRLKDVSQLAYNETRSEILKIENAIRLIRFTLQNKESNDENIEGVRQKTDAQLEEGLLHLETVKSRLNSEVASLIKYIPDILNEEVVINRANNLDGVIRINKAKKGVNKYFDGTKHLYERINEGIDRLLIKGRDMLAISGYHYRTKTFLNPHSRLADFTDKISLAPSVDSKLPFYYKQLFVGKHLAPKEALPNRKSELSQFKLALERFNSGRNGAILFTGEPLSGRSYLLQNALNINELNQAIYLMPPGRLTSDVNMVLDGTFSMATGMEGNTSQILSQLPEGTVLVFEDLEMWWTRTNEGSEYLKRIIKLIKNHGDRLLFILDCNIYFYQHIRQYIKIDDQLLATIAVAPLKTTDIREAVLNRHKSGGMTFEWKDKPEQVLRTRELNRLFKRITSQTEGNVGMAFYMWLGSITNVEKSIFQLDRIEGLELPPVLSSDWELMLLQVLLHKSLDFDRLCNIYHYETAEYVNNTIQSLVRSGLIIENAGGQFSISPYALPYIVKYLRRKQLVN